MAPATRSSTQGLTMATVNTSISVTQHIINICGFPDDSTMVEIFNQEGWTDIVDIAMLTMQEVDSLHSTNSDGSYKAKPMNLHLRQFKGFLMYYNMKCRELSTTLDNDDILSITKTQLFDYMGSPEYHDDIAGGLSKSTKPTTSGNQKEFTAVDFRKGTKRDKTCYSELKDDKHFNIWNRGFVSTAYTHHTQLVLDENYRPKTENEKEVFDLLDGKNT